MNGWAVPVGPARSRQWHYFQPDTALFPRWRSACGVHLLFGEPHLLNTIGATRTVVCVRCEPLARPIVRPGRSLPAVPGSTLPQRASHPGPYQPASRTPMAQLGEPVTLVSRVDGTDVQFERAALVLFDYPRSPREEINVISVRVVADTRYQGAVIRVGRQEMIVRVPHESHRTAEDLNWWK